MVPGVIAYIFTVASHGSRGEAIWSLKVVALFCYATALVLGIPAYNYLTSRGYEGFLSYVVTGAILGVSCIVILTMPMLGQLQSLQQSLDLLRTMAGLAVLGVICGSIATATFWVIAVLPTPNGIH